MKTHTDQKSELAVQVEKLFYFDQATTFATPSEQPIYGWGMRIVPSVTTYSTCEDPFPAPKLIK